jgi:hypothetical protein
MSTKLATYQIVNRTALPMVGSSANEELHSLLAKVDPQLSKLFEDRNILLSDGGLITYTGTTLQFTEALKISLNSKVAGGAPVVIDLGSATLTLSASGRMIYAVIDRDAGTATVTDDATTLAAVTSANQEVFLIAKRVDAADGTKRVYFRQGTALDEGQTVRLGSSGSGTGSGTGDDINTLSYRASFNDDFADKKAINSNAGFTDDSLYSAGKKLYRLSYDATLTVTTVGTAATMSGAPAFTVKAGDILVVAGEAKRIATVNTQTDYVLESALSADVAAEAACVSQAIHTVDIAAFNDSGNGLALNSIFTDSLESYMIVYRDSAALDDAVLDNGSPALAAFSVSTDNSEWTAPGIRPDSIVADNTERATASAGTSFYLRFFANATSGSGAVNVLDYKVYLYKETLTSSGSASLKALARTDGAGTAVNCSVSLAAGKTRITTTFVLGTEIAVYLDGKKLPEFVDATLTPDGSFKRINGTTIELDADYSGAGLQVEVQVISNTIDNTNANASNISMIQDLFGDGFLPFVVESKLTAVNGTPSASQFRSSIIGRLPIANITSDLKTRMGIERIPVTRITEVTSERGQNGERVWAPLGDSKNLIRFVGYTWQQVEDTAGPRAFATTASDYIEITFWGTGLNIITIANALRDHRATVDGGVEGSNFMPTGAPSAAISTRSVGSNQIVPVVSGLAAGLHTVKIRNAVGTSANLEFFGFEVLNESSSVSVQSGSAYVDGKKLAASAISELYTANVTGTRGGRKLVYLKANGAVESAFQAVDATAKYTVLADHTNEEVVREYNFREFGANRSDDFSTLVSASFRSFLMQDGSTNLTTNSAEISSGRLRLSTDTTSFVTITFIGTGLDIVASDENTGASYGSANLQVDGVTVANMNTITGVGATGRERKIKLCSGLPYGSHNVTIFRPGAAQNFPHIVSFIVYQPKKPALPAGAIELADYNVLATYSALSTPGLNTMSTGVIRKCPTREIIYNGASWTVNNDSVNSSPGTYVSSNGANNWYDYTFYGTGVDIRLGPASVGYTATISIDGSTNLSGYTTAVVGTNHSFVAATGALTVGVTTTPDNLLSIRGLTLAMHTVRVNRTGGTNSIHSNSLDIITPIHSHVNDMTPSNNNMVIGSCGISDIRSLSPLASDSKNKFKGTALYGGSVTTTSVANTYVPVPQLNMVVRSKGGWYRVNSQYIFGNSVANGRAYISIAVNGTLADELDYSNASSQNQETVYYNGLIYLPEGSHFVSTVMAVGSGTMTVNSGKMTVEEI